jgi:hypothetical protein
LPDASHCDTNELRRGADQARWLGGTWYRFCSHVRPLFLRDQPKRDTCTPPVGPNEGRFGEKVAYRRERARVLDVLVARACRAQRNPAKCVDELAQGVEVVGYQPVAISSASTPVGVASSLSTVNGLARYATPSPRRRPVHVGDVANPTHVARHPAWSEPQTSNRSRTPRRGRRTMPSALRPERGHMATATRVVEAGAPIDHAPARLNRTLTISARLSEENPSCCPKCEDPPGPGMPPQCVRCSRATRAYANSPFSGTPFVP